MRTIKNFSGGSPARFGKDGKPRNILPTGTPESLPSCSDADAQWDSGVPTGRKIIKTVLWVLSILAIPGLVWFFWQAIPYFLERYA